MTELCKIEGVDPHMIQLLEDAGISSVEQLLEEGGTHERRRTLSQKTGIDQHHIHEWVKQVDLTRIEGIGKEYAELLVSVGVVTINFLVRQEPKELRDRLSHYNRTHSQVRRIPDISRIERWILYARRIQPGTPP